MWRFFFYARETFATCSAASSSTCATAEHAQRFFKAAFNKHATPGTQLPHCTRHFLAAYTPDNFTTPLWIAVSTSLSDKPLHEHIIIYISASEVAIYVHDDNANEILSQMKSVYLRTTKNNNFIYVKCHSFHFVSNFILFKIIKLNIAKNMKVYILTK